LRRAGAGPSAVRLSSGEGAVSKGFSQQRQLAFSKTSLSLLSSSTCQSASALYTFLRMQLAHMVAAARLVREIELKRAEKSQLSKNPR
jgi:hypothetical protein